MPDPEVNSAGNYICVGSVDVDTFNCIIRADRLLDVFPHENWEIPHYKVNFAPKEMGDVAYRILAKCGPWQLLVDVEYSTKPFLAAVRLITKQPIVHIRDDKVTQKAAKHSFPLATTYLVQALIHAEIDPIRLSFWGAKCEIGTIVAEQTVEWNPAAERFKTLLRWAREVPDDDGAAQISLDLAMEVRLKHRLTGHFITVLFDVANDEEAESFQKELFGVKLEVFPLLANHAGGLRLKFGQADFTYTDSAIVHLLVYSPIAHELKKQLSSEDVQMPKKIARAKDTADVLFNFFKNILTEQMFNLTMSGIRFEIRVEGNVTLEGAFGSLIALSSKITDCSDHRIIRGWVLVDYQTYVALNQEILQDVADMSIFKRRAQSDITSVGRRVFYAMLNCAGYYMPRWTKDAPPIDLTNVGYRFVRIVPDDDPLYNPLAGPELSSTDRMAYRYLVENLWIAFEGNQFYARYRNGGRAFGGETHTAIFEKVWYRYGANWVDKLFDEESMLESRSRLATSESTLKAMIEDAKQNEADSMSSSNEESTETSSAKEASSDEKSLEEGSNHGTSEEDTSLAETSEEGSSEDRKSGDESSSTSTSEENSSVAESSESTSSDDDAASGHGSQRNVPDDTAENVLKNTSLVSGRNATAMEIDFGHHRGKTQTQVGSVDASNLSGGKSQESPVKTIQRPPAGYGLEGSDSENETLLRLLESTSPRPSKRTIWRTFGLPSRTNTAQRPVYAMDGMNKAPGAKLDRVADQGRIQPPTEEYIDQDIYVDRLLERPGSREGSPHKSSVTTAAQQDAARNPARSTKSGDNVSVSTIEPPMQPEVSSSVTAQAIGVEDGSQARASLRLAERKLGPVPSLNPQSKKARRERACFLEQSIALAGNANIISLTSTPLPPSIRKQRLETRTIPHSAKVGFSHAVPPSPILPVPFKSDERAILRKDISCISRTRVSPRLKYVPKAPFKNPRSLDPPARASPLMALIKGDAKGDFEGPAGPDSSAKVRANARIPPGSVQKFTGKLEDKSRKEGPALGFLRLQNKGSNACYLNATLQAFDILRHFGARFCNGNGPQHMVSGSLSDVLRRTLSGRRNSETFAKELLDVLVTEGSFRRGQQEDASELVGFILQGIKADFPDLVEDFAQG